MPSSSERLWAYPCSPMNNFCEDCGRPALGLRCRLCNGKRIKLETAKEHAEADAALLAEGISGDRLAIRLGVSKARGYGLIRNAQRRQQVLREAK